MLSNPFYDNGKGGEEQESLSNKNLLDDITEQSVDVSNIEDQEPNQRAVFVNPLQKKDTDLVSSTYLFLP
jgi:hypothetical protein